MKTAGLHVLLFSAFLLRCLATEAQEVFAPPYGTPLDSFAAPLSAVDSTSRKPAPSKPAGVDLSRFPSGTSPGAVYGERVDAYLSSHPHTRLYARALELPQMKRRSADRDWVFYLFATCLVLMGLTRVLFPGYLESTVGSFFGNRPSVNKSLDGVGQHSLASVWMNLLFVLNGSVFLFFLPAVSRGADAPVPPWQSIAFWAFLLSAVYAAKYGLLLLSAWVMGKTRRAHEYMSIVFQVNRVAGILLLVFSLLLAFTDGGHRQALLAVAWVLLSVLVAVRLTRCYGYLNRTMRVGLLPFLLLFLAFEALPVLLLRKALADLFL